MASAPVAYEQLADWHERRGEARQRDQFLALAADAAYYAGRPDLAERCRQRLLQVSPYHLLRPYPTFADSLQSPDVVDYLTDLRNQYPPDRVAQMLEGLKASASPSLAALAFHVSAPPSTSPASSKPAETLVGSAGRPPVAAAQTPRRRSAPSPYDDRTPAPLTPTPPEGPALAWVPSFLFLVVLLLGLSWLGFVFVAPFLR